MARTKNNQRSASRVAVDVGATGVRPVSKGTVAILLVSVLAAIWSVAMMTAPGRIGYYYFFIYAEFYMGVIALVSLSITIMVGLVATDRLVLSIRQRVLLQSTHRTTGLIAVVSLFVHVWTKEVEHHIRLVDAFIPFLSPFNRLYIGFGTISGLIMVLVMWTGLARARFIGQGKPWMWRSVHAISYLMWPIALVHGLAAGRAAKAWVTVSYILCILIVLIGLAVRLSVSLNRRKDFASTSTGGMKPVGKLVPTSAPAVKKRPSRREQEMAATDALGPVAVLDTWVPAAPVTGPPAMSPAPQRGRRFAEDENTMVVPRQRPARDEEFYEEPVRGRRRPDDDFDYEEEPRPARGRRYADDDMADTSTRMRRGGMDDTSTRMRRVEMDDTSTRMRRAEVDDTSTRMRRAEMDDTSTRMRRAEMEDTSTRMRRPEVEDSRSLRPDFDEPTGRQRRYVEDDEPAPRSRRRAEEPLYDDAPRGRRRADDGYDVPSPQRGSRFGADARYGREEEDAPRVRRDRGADIDRADSGRHSRSEFVDFADREDDPNYLAPDDTPTLVDMASRRARRAAQGAPQEAVRGQASRGARRSGRGRANDDVADDGYWSQLRGEAN